MKTSTLLILPVLSFGASVASAQITGVNIFDDTVSFFNGTTEITTGVFEVRWGTFAANVFTPYYGSVAGTSNDGYIGDPFGAFELYASLTAADNTVAAVGSQMFLAVTLLADNADYVSSLQEVVLTDPSWVVPVLALAGDPVDYAFTPATNAVKGGFAFSPLDKAITISSTVIPEPSSFAALAGLAVLGMVASRRRRSS